MHNTKKSDYVKCCAKGTKNRRDKSDVGENFVPPDGGWGWLVCVAAGISNLSLYPCLQQFGFIFREHLYMLGFVSSEITAIINTNSAISACTGLLNGPMFRRFTYRQVALMGSIMVFCGIFLTAFCETFICYIVTDALLYGKYYMDNDSFGMGISMSASSLAINTYFKKQRTKATGWSWTITGLGPIVLPHIVTFLVGNYGVRGTVMIIAAFSLHTFVSALIYQPVHYHTKKSIFKEIDLNHSATNCNGASKENHCLNDLSSIEIKDVCTQMLSHNHDDFTIANKAENNEGDRFNARLHVEVTSVQYSCLQKLIAFFDLDLLKDISFINLVLGLTIINFGELNFAILLPFILNEFGLNTSQTTLLMSILASMDIVVRFFGPFFTSKIPWDNRVFFLIGVLGIAVGRAIIACHHTTFPLMVICFTLMGCFKGLRTIYWPLIMPGCVPLKRLPAASGLQLLISGLFTLAGGPFVGLVRDRLNYAATLHILNALTFLGAFLWGLEAAVKRYKNFKFISKA